MEFHMVRFHVAFISIAKCGYACINLFTATDQHIKKAKYWDLTKTKINLYQLNKSTYFFLANIYIEIMARNLERVQFPQYFASLK